ncbi:MAG: hypothetical protein IRY90_03080 [Actinomadura rubrobrunea]|nr:hypothetical protein [Actinomadura rubrobrunea]
MCPLPPAGGDGATLKGSLGSALGLLPLSGTMPVLRPLPDGTRPLDDDGPKRGGPGAVFDAAVTPSRQTWAFVRRDGALSGPARRRRTNTAEIVLDRAGLTVDYCPSAGRRGVPGPAGAPVTAP